MADTITLPVVNLQGTKTGDVKLSKEVFGLTEKNEQAVHDAVFTQMSNARQATAKTKKRHEVAGGGKKPWKQKGTGRARAGSSRSPLWVGGGKVFGPDGNQNYTVSQNKKQHALAMKTVLSQKAAKGLIVVDEFKLEKISCKDFKKDLENIKSVGKTLLVVDPANVNLVKSASNLSNVELRAVNNISVYDILNAEYLVIAKEDVKTLEGGLK
ncbi:MAG: 50S ribosomal protein L4 [Bacilli bacterium]|jgi:large subunit ribosomal protein L4|nr:50S ribosomal protein L4 [Bacilli bacterium]MCH4228140.1 50S ribosomal protein L4 [Bacilli bacterium]MCH4278150.1 50S ribosomal protein L4 [Bacilli bacterium]MCI2054554.1 50S ribosomal protein L4 [Bacilli bacterium]